MAHPFVISGSNLCHCWLKKMA